MSEFNPSSCKLIYVPQGRAREYAALACNVYRGCGHGCIYCYAPAATRRPVDDFYRPDTRGPSFLADLEKEAARYWRAGVTGQVLLSFTCDPYQPIDVEHQVTRHAIEILHRAGLSVCILTKGGQRALRDLDLFRPGDAFATTLTFHDPADSLKWEPEAAPPYERIATLAEFHAAGIPTWVSLEPVIDPADALAHISHTHPVVDLFKVGKLNHHPDAAAIDWRSFALKAIELLTALGYRPEPNLNAVQDASPTDRLFYIKADLLRYLRPDLLNWSSLHIEFDRL